MVGIGAEDMIFTCCLLCVAKNYVLVPNVIYFYRIVENSISHQKLTIVNTLKKYIRMLAVGLNYIEAFMKKRQCNPNLQYIAFEAITQELMRYITPIYSAVSASKLNKFICSEFEKSKNLSVLTSYFFGRMNVFYVKTLLQQNKIFDLEKQVEKLQEQLQQAQKGRLM